MSCGVQGLVRELGRVFRVGGILGWRGVQYGGMLENGGAWGGDDDLAGVAQDPRSSNSSAPPPGCGGEPLHPLSSPTMFLEAHGTVTPLSVPWGGCDTFCSSNSRGTTWIQAGSTPGIAGESRGDYGEPGSAGDSKGTMTSPSCQLHQAGTGLRLVK